MAKKQTEKRKASTAKVTERRKGKPESGDELARRRKRKKKKLRKKRGKTFFAVSVVVLALLGIITVVYFVLQVEKINVFGLQNKEPSEVLGMTDVTLGDNMLLVSKDKMESDISKNPYFVVERIEKDYPNSINIYIRERVAVASIACASESVLIDDEGYVLEICAANEGVELLRVFGISSTGFHTDQLLSDHADFHTATLVDILKHLKTEDLLEQIVLLDVSNPLSVYMVTDTDIRVQIGQPDMLDKKFSQLTEVMPRLREMGAAGGTLTLTGKGRAVYSPPEPEE